MAVAKNEILRNFFAWHIYVWGMPQGPSTKVKIENHRMVLFDSSNEASWCTDYNAKKLELISMNVLEKMRLDRQKGPTKFEPFYSFSWFFPKWYLKQSKFLHHCTQCIKTLHISLQTPYEHEQFWKKSGKTTIRVQFFWTFLTVKSYFFKNGPSKWFRGGLSATPRGWTGQKPFSKCLSWTLRHSPSI